MIRYTIFKTTLGWCCAVNSSSKIVRFYLPVRDRKQLVRLVRSEYPNAKLSSSGLEALIDDVRAYFMGKSVDLNYPLDFSIGTEFQKKVWRAILSIRWGKRLSYSQVATRIGKPSSSRAVGLALSKNPLPLLVPCHRVIRKNGAVGGFSAGGGARLKKRMLELETDMLQNR